MADDLSIVAKDHLAYMQYALSLAKKVLPKPTNFCVGAVLVEENANRIVSTGYTMELPGNTHAEQCCLMKLGEHVQNHDEAQPRLVLYTTMEPCNQRASGNAPCTEAILKTKGGVNGGIKTVYVGVQEPEIFVRENVGRSKLEGAGIEYIHVPGLEQDILTVATLGHEKKL